MKRGTLSGVTLHGDEAVVILNDSICGRQPEARDALLFPGGENRTEV